MPKSVASPDPWHYARPELAGKYLQTFDLGLMTARGLFAKRRMGKSEFLEQDLIPAAQAAGYLTAYLNLWDARSNPAPSLLATLGRAVAPVGVARLMQRLQAPLKKVKASGKLPGMGEAAIEAELSDVSASAGPLLSELLRGFDAPGKRLLLVLDEAQVLADPLHTELAHSLRAGLDSRKHNIKVVFAGSSEPTLRRMFGRSSEPFYNWAPLEPFELLGVEFVQAMVAKVNKLSRYPLLPSDAMTAFSELKSTPEFFRRYLNRYLTHAELGASMALVYTADQVFSAANFADTWSALLPADQQVLKLLVRGVRDLHSENTRTQLGVSLGLGNAATKNTPQQSLQRLQDAGIVAKLDHGHYQLQDDAMAEWLRSIDLDG